jgi:hypothetical protein
MVISGPPPAASVIPASAGARGSMACEASSGFAMSRPGNCVRNFAAASRIAA